MDIKKFEQYEKYEKVAEAARVLSWLRGQSILNVAFNDIEEIAMEYAGLHEPVYELWADGKAKFQTKSKTLIESQFKEFVDSDKYDNIQIKKKVKLDEEGKVIKEWMDMDAHAIKGKKEEPEPEAIAENTEEYHTEETVKIKSPNAQFTYELCQEFGWLNWWKGKADASLVKRILANRCVGYPKADGSTPTEQDKWMRAVHITGVKGKDFWARAKGLYEAYKKATANPVAK